MHQYRIDYVKNGNNLGPSVLAEVLVHSDLEKEDFVADVAANGHWLDGKNWIAPGCLQGVVVVA